MSVLLEFSMFPTSEECRKGASVSEKVSKIVKMIDEKGVAYKLTPMGTIIETETLREALDVVALAYEELEECERVYGAMKVDIRKNKPERLTQKVDSVAKHMGKMPNT